MKNEDQLRQLYIKHYGYLIRFARSFVKNDLAEDLVQETFLIAQKRLDRVLSSENPTGWLINTLKNCNWKYISKAAIYLYKVDSRNCDR